MRIWLRWWRVISNLVGWPITEYPNELMFQPDEKEQQNRFSRRVVKLTLKQGLSEAAFLDAQSDFTWLASVERHRLYGRQSQQSSRFAGSECPAELVMSLNL